MEVSQRNCHQKWWEIIWNPVGCKLENGGSPASQSICSSFPTKQGMRFQSLPRKLTCTLENRRTAFLLKYFWVHVSFRECISTTPNVDFGLKAHRLAELLTARWNLDQGCLQSGSLMIEFAGGKVVVLQFSNTCWSKQLAIWRQMAPYFCFGI